MTEPPTVSALNEVSSNSPSRGSQVPTSRVTVTPKDYISSIYAHALRTAGTSIYAGPHYHDLASWLNQDPRRASVIPTASDGHHLAIVHNLTGADSPCCLSSNQIDDLRSYPQPPKSTGQLLFLRGYLLPAWIGTIGSRFGVDPEFIRRHLEFFVVSDQRRVFSVPSLASKTDNIIQLCVNTILVRDHSLAPIGSEEFHWYRREHVEAFATYKRQLQTHIGSGDSLVREYSLLDGRYAVLDQCISVCVTKNGSV